MKSLAFSAVNKLQKTYKYVTDSLRLDIVKSTLTPQGAVMKLLLGLLVLFFSVQSFADDNSIVYTPSSDNVKIADDAASAVAGSYEYGGCFVGNPEKVLKKYFYLGQEIDDAYDSMTYEVTEYTVSSASINVEFSVYETSDKSKKDTESLSLSECADDIKKQL